MSIQNQIDSLVTYQAADWFEYFRTDGAEGADDTRRQREAEFAQWLAESPRNIEALLAVASDAPLLRGVLLEQLADLPGQLGRLSPQVSRLQAAALPHRQTSKNPFPRRSGRWIAAAAAVALIACAALVYDLLAGQHFETQVGEQRTVQLNEGSTVTLNTRSHIDVRFDKTRRDINLTEGEAIFRVARERARPFRVHTAGAVIEAIGTQFNVYARPDGSTAVAVLEGRVRVSTGASALSLAAGEEAVVSSKGAIAPRPAADVSEAVAWQQRKLLFKRTPLAEMAEQFNRYNRNLRIRLEGIAPDKYRVNASLNADDPQSLADLLEREPELLIERREGEIVIRQRRAPQP